MLFRCVCCRNLLGVFMWLDYQWFLVFMYVCCIFVCRLLVCRVVMYDLLLLVCYVIRLVKLVFFVLVLVCSSGYQFCCWFSMFMMFLFRLVSVFGLLWVMWQFSVCRYFVLLFQCYVVQNVCIVLLLLELLFNLLSWVVLLVQLILLGRVKFFLLFLFVWVRQLLVRLIISVWLVGLVLYWFSRNVGCSIGKEYGFCYCQFGLWQILLLLNQLLENSRWFCGLCRMMCLLKVFIVFIRCFSVSGLFQLRQSMVLLVLMFFLQECSLLVLMVFKLLLNMLLWYIVLDSVVSEVFN